MCLSWIPDKKIIRPAVNQYAALFVLRQRFECTLLTPEVQLKKKNLKRVIFFDSLFFPFFFCFPNLAFFRKKNASNFCSMSVNLLLGFCSRTLKLLSVFVFLVKKCEKCVCACAHVCVYFPKNTTCSCVVLCTALEPTVRGGVYTPVRSLIDILPEWLLSICLKSTRSHARLSEPSSASDPDSQGRRWVFCYSKLCASASDRLQVMRHKWQRVEGGAYWRVPLPYLYQSNMIRYDGVWVWSSAIQYKRRYVISDT